MKQRCLLTGLLSLLATGCSGTGPGRADDTPIAASAGALPGCERVSAQMMNLAAFEAEANHLLELEPSAAGRHLVCMRQADPGLAEALMLYRGDLGTRKGTEAAFLHYVVNTPEPRLGDESIEELERLERRYRESLLLDARADANTDTIETLADLSRTGQALNMRRYGRADRVPTVLFGFDDVPGDYSRRNAAWMAEMAALAYWDPALTERQLAAWGYERVAEFTDDETETRAFLARKGQRLVLSFRGTSSLRNFKTDAQFRKVETVWADGTVHRGFAMALDSVWPRIAAQLGSPGEANAQLWLTGHSLGAALAQLAALRLEKNGYPVAAVYTYGTPRIGNEAFVADYDRHIGERTFAHINNDDIVARVPPRLMGFRQTARPQTLKFTGAGHDLEWFDQGSQLPDIEKVDDAIDSIRETTRFLPDLLRSPTLTADDTGGIPMVFYDRSFEVGPLDEHGSFQYLFKLSCVVLEKDLWPEEARQAGLSPEDFDFSR
jgi:triacylglycerol lipase